MLALAVLMITTVGMADAGKGETETLHDNRLLSHLHDLSQNGNFVTEEDGKTYTFETIVDSDGWHYTTITTTEGTNSESVSFKFMYDALENTYLLQAEEPDLDVKIPVPETTVRWQDPPSTINKIVSDSSSTSPTNLYDRETQWCIAWTDSWEVESNVSNYVGKVLIEWDGETSFNYYCLFPYSLSGVTISYEGQNIYNIASGDDHLNEGSPTYNLSGNWRYNSVN